MLVSSGKAQRFDYTEDALNFLDAVGIDGLNRYGKMSTKLHTTLNVESAQQYEASRRMYQGTLAVPEPLADALLDHNGWLLESTMQKLGELGYLDTAVDNRGNGLPPGVMDILRGGQLPPRKEKLEEISKIETIEEACERRNREFKAQQAAHKAQMEAKRKERENANVEV